MAESVSAIVDEDAWATLTAYSVGDYVENDSPTNLYICTGAGTSAGSGGPTGTGSGISDGTCTWDFVVEIDYADLVVWEDATDIALTTGTQYIAEVYNTTAIDAANCLVAGATNTNSTTYREVRPAPGQGSQQLDTLWPDETKGGYVAITGNYRVGIRWQEGYNRGTNLQLVNTAPVAPNACYESSEVNATGTMRNIIAMSPNAAHDNVNMRGTFINCVSICTGGSGNPFGAMGNYGAQLGAVNCLGIGVTPTVTGTGISEGQGTGNRVRNTAIAGMSTDFDAGGGWHADSDRNWSSDATAPGANSFDSTDSTDIADEVISPTSDLTPKAGGFFEGGGIIIAGAELDFFGNSRGTAGGVCDIGPMIIPGAPPAGGTVGSGLLTGLKLSRPRLAA